MTASRIQLARPLFGEEELAAVKRVLDSGWLVQGAEVAAFETAVAELHDMKFAVAVSSATAGLHLLYHALEIGPGDVVLVPSFAWPSAANMAVRAGATPFFMDVDPVTANVTGATLRRALQEVSANGLPKPRAVVVVHEFGLPAKMAEILEIASREGLIVLEDAACALGAHHGSEPVGRFGRAAVFSFHPRKSVSTGEGGMVVTNEGAIADSVRALRNHGQESVHGRREFTSAGFNYRLTEMQAAIGREQLKRLPTILSARRELAARYFVELDGVNLLMLPARDQEHTWQTYMITLTSDEQCRRVQEVCREAGVETGPAAVAGHRSANWGGKFLEPTDLCPVSSNLANCGLALPLHPQLTPADIGRVAEVVRRALAA